MPVAKVASKSEVRAWVRDARSRGERVGLVPTMGYLHAGHLSLVEIARERCDRVAISVFVNPLQFGANEDLDRYPRDLDRDLHLAETAAVDLVFAPSVQEMYGDGEPWVAVVPERGADDLEGVARPGHFRGVLTVVAKLLGIFTPDVAVFGQKDLQQLALIRRMVRDLDLAVDVRGAPIVREPDGLAMSSRNTYLSPEERLRALALYRSLERCETLFRGGETDPAVYRAALLASGEAGVEVEYGEVVDATTLEPVARVEAGAACAIAARVGRTRLIDNLILGS